MIEFFHRLYHFEELIRWGGHLVLVSIVFAETGLMGGFFLPGDSLLVTAGLIAAARELNIYLLVSELCVAAIAGDSLNYAVGRKLGSRLFTRQDSLLFHKDHLLRAKRFYEKYGSKTIVIARFIPLIRTFAPTVAGIGEMDYSVFLTYNIVGGVAWVCSMLFTGYFLGRVIPNVERHVHKIILIVILLSLLPAVIEIWRERRSKAHSS